MIPLKLVGHFYIDGYGIVTTYEDGYGVKYSSAVHQIMLPWAEDSSRKAVVFDGYGVPSLKTLIKGISADTPGTVTNNRDPRPWYSAPGGAPQNTPPRTGKKRLPNI